MKRLFSKHTTLAGVFLVLNACNGLPIMTSASTTPVASPGSDPAAVTAASPSPSPQGTASVSITASNVPSDATKADLLFFKPRSPDEKASHQHGNGMGHGPMHHLMHGPAFWAQHGKGKHQGNQHHHKALVKKVEVDVKQGAAITADGIPAGTYRLFLIIKGSDGRPEARGKADVTVAQGQTANVTVTLSSIDASGMAETSPVPSATPVASVGALLMVPATTALPVAASCIAFNVQSVDANGNAAPVAQDTVVALQSSSTTGAFYQDSACSQPIQNVTLASGNSTVAIYYLDPQASVELLRATESPSQGWADQQLILALAPAPIATTSPVPSPAAQ